MKNSLIIKSDVWPEVTATPHYIVELNYEAHSSICEDVYFDDVEKIVSELTALEVSRSGRVELDGGHLFKLVVEATVSGGLVLDFRFESGNNFPGKLVLEGFFPVEGEHTAHVIEALWKLFVEGDSFVYEV